MRDQRKSPSFENGSLTKTCDVVKRKTNGQGRRHYKTNVDYELSTGSHRPKWNKEEDHTVCRDICPNLNASSRRNDMTLEGSQDKQELFTVRAIETPTDNR